MKSREREIRKLIERAELRCVELGVTGSNHYMARLQRASGEVRKFIFAATPGDRRSDKNKLSGLRHFARTGEVRA